MHCLETVNFKSVEKLTFWMTIMRKLRILIVESIIENTKLKYDRKI